MSEPFKLSGTFLVPRRLKISEIEQKYGIFMSADKEVPSGTPSKTGRFDQDRLPDKIGSSLRQIYDDVLNEDIPEDFLNILKSADDKNAGPERRVGQRSTE